MHKIILVNASRYFVAEGKSLLDRRDFQVFLAPTGSQALELHRREKVNLIVADLDMPEMAGDTLCSRLREDAELCAVSFILVCRNSPAELARAANCGANICLHKPFTAETLCEHVEKLLTISVRRGYRVLLRARVQGAKDDAVFFCTSQNISGTGMLIETDRSLLPGDQLTCSFFLPGAEQITAAGKVVRTETAADGKHHCGIIFTGLAAAHKRDIEEFIAGTVTQP
jgi:DNA-binding response OmpR family regulator